MTNQILEEREILHISSTLKDGRWSNIEFAHAIIAATIEKLSKGVSVEPEQVAARWPSVPGSHNYAGAGKCAPNSFGPESEDLFTRDQLQTAIAAARVQALINAADTVHDLVIEHVGSSVRTANQCERAIRALIGGGNV